MSSAERQDLRTDCTTSKTRPPSHIRPPFSSSSSCQGVPRPWPSTPSASPLLDYDESSPVGKLLHALLPVQRYSSGVVQLFSWLAWDVRAHIPRVGGREEGLVAQLRDVLPPSFFSLFGGLDGLDVLLFQLLDGFDDPISLDLHTRRTVGESGRA